MRLQGVNKMKLVLQQKQQLNLVMTTELRQAIALLQHSTQDLYEYLKEQEQENPLIELVEKSDAYNRPKNKTIQSNEDYVNPLDFVANKERDMREILMEQVSFKQLSEENKAQLNYLILNLDSHGYLSFDEKELTEQLDIDESTYEYLISILQSLEPVGVGARNLSDSLRIQLDYYYPDELLAKTLVNSYLSELANKQWQAISKAENVSLKEIDKAFEIIKTLNPRPVTNDEDSEVTFVTPDIIVEYDQEIKSFTIKLNDHYIPDIRFNHSYTNEDRQLNDYVQTQFKKYQWLKNSIEQRRSTIIKIINVLLKKQSDFFNNGLKGLKPLTLKEVANLIDMHESTVSRATDNKIIQTALGTFELKSLFSTRMQTTTGEDTSQTQVKSVLESMIKKEDKYKPLSDQKLAEEMKITSGIKISRRTIAKYRDELNIPSSSKRKEIKII